MFCCCFGVFFLFVCFCWVLFFFFGGGGLLSRPQVRVLGLESLQVPERTACHENFEKLDVTASGLWSPEATGTPERASTKKPEALVLLLSVQTHRAHFVTLVSYLPYRK